MQRASQQEGREQEKIEKEDANKKQKGIKKNIKRIIKNAKQAQANCCQQFDR